MKYCASGPPTRSQIESGRSASEHPLGEVLPQLGEVAGDHRGALPLHITAIPEVAVVVDGDRVTVEGDLDGLVGGQHERK